MKHNKANLTQQATPLAVGELDEAASEVVGEGMGEEGMGEK